MVDTKSALEQSLRADDADQRDAHRGGDDPAHTQAASESIMNLTKQALSDAVGRAYAINDATSVQQLRLHTTLMYVILA